ncbi:hypothetical protein PILCRDRAFT_535526 [Piloderma croceum F 1598]|uniref:Uncharacterized protein n=1 Tax=Piloderma croceum (strain F 1598) TaxID=765440 RepID=A0A0C3FJQ5_PILCF|nr:hypothetical protein PILCRDRAFT_535526 [Piloderma croceum F 1598]
MTSNGLHQADMCVYGQREAEEGQGGMIVHEEEEGLQCCSGFTDNLARAHKRGENGKDDMVGRRGTGRSTIAQKKCTQINEKSRDPRVLKQKACGGLTPLSRHTQIFRGFPRSL